MPGALIIGIDSEDGAYLARLLRARGQAVAGTLGDATAGLARLDALGVLGDVALHEPTSDAGAGLAALLGATEAGEIYDLDRAAADAPDDALAAMVTRSAALLAACAAHPGRPRVFSAGSGAVFGDTGDAPATEATPFNPVTAFGRAAAAIARDVANARDAGLFAVTGLAFDHPSRLGDPGGDAATIVAAAHAVAAGTATHLILADPEAIEDWGWAPEYVDAMARMLHAPVPRDYVLATGKPYDRRSFAADCCRYFGLDPAAVIRAEGSAARTRVGDPSAALRDLGWRAYTSGKDLAETLCEGLAARG